MVVDSPTALSLTLFRPLVVVDCLEGLEWFAEVFDGAHRVQVTEWPLRDARFQVGSSTVLHVELHLAEDAESFRQGRGRRFADVHLPAAKVREAAASGLYRAWFGLQRGYHYPLEQSSDVSIASQLYDIGLALAQNLLTPKICLCLVEAAAAKGLLVPAESVQSAGTCAPLGAQLDGPEAHLRRSLLQHGSIIAQLHRQLRALWAQGRLTCQERPNGDLAAHLSDFSIDPDLDPERLSSLLYGGSGLPCDAEAMVRLQDRSQRLEDSLQELATRLEESERSAQRQHRLKLNYRERLCQLTHERLDDDDEEPCQVEVPEGCLRQLRDALLGERRRAEARDAQLRRGEQERLDALQLQQQVQQKYLEAAYGLDAARGERDGSEELRQLHALEMRRLRASEGDLRQQLKELKRDFDSVSRELVQREADTSALREELKDRTAKLVESWSAQGGGAGAADDAGARREAALLRELADAQGRLQELEAAQGGNGATHAKEVLHQDNEVLRRRNVTLQERLDELQREFDRASGEAIMQKVEHEEKELKLRHELKWLKIKDEQRAGEVEATTRLKAEVQDLRRERAALAEEQQILRTRAEKMAELNERLDEQMEQLRGSEREALAKLSESRQRLLELEPVHDELRRKEEAHAQTAQSLQATQEAHAQVELQLRATSEELQAKQRSWSSENENLRSSATQLHEQVRKLEADLAAKHQELDLRRSGTAAAEAERQRLSEELVALRAERRGLELAARETEERLQAEIRDLEDANEDLQLQAQRQLEEMSLLQDSIAAEIVDFRKEYDLKSVAS